MQNATLMGLTFMPATSYRISEQFSVGAGLIYSRADVTLSQAIDFGSVLFSNPATRPLPFALPQAADGFAEVQGDDAGVGFIVGANFSPTDMLAIGEQTGDMSSALGHIARRYENDLDRSIKIFTTALEPILIVLVALVVGFVAVSILMAVFNLSSGLNG